MSFLDKIIQALNGTDNNNHKIDDLNNEIEKYLKDVIPAYNVQGSDRAFTDMFASMIQQQYTNPSRNSGTNQDINSLLKQFNIDTSDARSRKDLYNSYKFLVKNIPQLDNAIETIAENIIAPDEIFKEILRITPKLDINTSENRIVTQATLEANNINNIIKSLSIDEKLFSWISNSLLLGCTFVEILESNTISSTYLSENTSGAIETKNTSLIEKEIRASKEKKKRLIESLELSKNEIYSYRNKDHKEVKVTEETLITNIIENELFTIEDDIDLIGNEELYTIKEDQKINALSDKDFKDLVFNSLKVKKKTSKTKIEKNNKIYEESLSSIILLTHESENVVKISSSGYIVGYLVINEETINTSVENKIFGSVGNIFDVNNNTLEQTNKKMSDYILNTITEKLKQKNNSNYKNLNIDEVEIRKIITTLLVDRKSIKARFVASSNMMEFINRSKYGNKDYGQSVLDPALFLSKYYISLLISYTIFNITRAPEKRIFKVEVKSDSNVTNSIENVAKKVKAKEQSFKNFDRLDSINRELSPFDDLFIPMVDGVAPIQLEYAPGQGSNIDMTYMSDILRQIINATKVPPTLLGDNENSYHTSASQESYKFSKHIVRKQSDVSLDLTKGISKIYRIIHKEQIQYNKIIFNPPIFAQLEQVGTMVGQATALCEFVSNAYGKDNNGNDIIPYIDVAKQYAKFVDWDKLDEIVQIKNRRDVINNAIDKIKRTDIGIDNQIDQDPSNDPNNDQES